MSKVESHSKLAPAYEEFLDSLKYIGIPELIDECRKRILECIENGTPVDRWKIRDQAIDTVWDHYPQYVSRLSQIGYPTD